MIACSIRTAPSTCEKRPSTSSPFSIRSVRAAAAVSSGSSITSARACTYGASPVVRTSTVTTGPTIPISPRQA